MRAAIVETKANGFVMRLIGSSLAPSEVWLPSEEWSQDPERWAEARAALDPGAELDVMLLPRLLAGRQIVSRKAFTYQSVDDSWIHTIRDMRVIDVGKTLVRGIIGDCIPAVVVRQPCMDWLASRQLSQELRDHSVLAKGDVIRGFVKSRSGDFYSVELSSAEYLDFRNEEIAKSVESTIIPQKEDDNQTIERSNRKLETDVLEAACPILLVENDKACCESIAAVLRREGATVETLSGTEDARRFISEWSPERSQPPRLAIIDPNLDMSNTDLYGLQFAKELQAITACRVILMTGEVGNGKKLKDWPDLALYGYIEKSFTMDRLFEAIEEAIALDVPIPLEAWIQSEEERPVPEAVKKSSTGVDDTSQVSPQVALDALGSLRPGVVIHLFELHPRSGRARSLAQFGQGINWEHLRGKIAKSVIKDAAESSRPIIDNRVGPLDKLHLWTQEMFTYQSFCGVPAQVEGRQLAVVAFHPEANAFDETFVWTAQLCAERAARAVERQRLHETRRNEALLAFSGMALASLAHELVSDLTTLDACLDELESSFDSPASSLDAIRRIRTNVDGISEKTKTLRGGRGRAPGTSIVTCLKKASAACRAVVSSTMANPQRILLEDMDDITESWEVNVSPSSLIIVFFNLFLNASQQISLASGIRRYGKIWYSLSRYAGIDGREWARVRVHDTGPGIHRDDWERVFEPGYSTKPDGSGLGLYICRYLLKGLSDRGASSKLEVTSSTIWDGTTFSLSLPLSLGNTTGHTK